MIITDEEATELKSWVVKKLEDISDADSDVLADYVLALIRADTPEPELRLNAIENLEDFLKDNTAGFVDAIFLAIHSRSYMPGYVPQPSVPPVTPFTAAPANAHTFSGDLTKNGPYSEPQSRKRPYSDRNEDSGTGDMSGDRQVKQIRRGSGRNGRVDAFGTRNGRGGFHSSGSPNALQGTGLNFPSLPISPPPPFDPSDPFAAMMAMQVMGLPGLAMPPTGFGQFGVQPPQLPGIMNQPQVKSRCRDYDTKGYCTRGNACPFEHGSDPMIVAGQEEYDPKNSIMMDITKVSSDTNGYGTLPGSRGGGPKRGSGRGRGDRGGNTNPRRNRAEFSHSGPNHDHSITTIVVEQIPEEHFDEQAVRGFFSTFGSISEVNMQPYKRLALVKFENYGGARRAYDSPKVIFDNRFVKVYWYKPEDASTPAVPANGDASKPSVSVSGGDEQSYDKEKFERDALAAQKRLDEKKSLLRETEAKRQALEKQREDLARRQADEKKKLMEKLAAKGRSKDMDLDPSSPSSELKNPPANGSDDGAVSAQTKALRAQVAALEAEARSLGLDSVLTEDPWAYRGRGRGRGGRGSYRGWEAFGGRGTSFDPQRGGVRGRGGFRGGRGGGAYNLDNRTRKVGITGIAFDGDKDEALRQYLLGIGEFEAIESPADRADFQVITFKDRFTAERFLHGPKDIPGVGLVDLSWVNNNTSSSSSAPATGVGGSLPPFQGGAKSEGETGTGTDRMEADDSGLDRGAGEVDYDVAEEDDRWMVE